MTGKRECWRLIAGYDDYAISDKGRVLSLNSGKYLSGVPNTKGYLRVHLPERRVFIHRLVAGAFLPPPSYNQTQVNHKNGNPGDNRVENLEWVTASQNLQHAYDELGRKSATQGKHLSPETRAKISSANKGCVRTEGWHLRQSESHRGKFLRGNNPNAKPVICLETREVFPCARSAAEHYGVHYNSLINSCIKGTRAGGYHFSYYTKGTDK